MRLRRQSLSIVGTATVLVILVILSGVAFVVIAGIVYCFRLNNYEQSVRTATSKRVIMISWVYGP